MALLRLGRNSQFLVPIRPMLSDFVGCALSISDLVGDDMICMAALLDARRRLAHTFNKR